jgi:hypothetical protein
MRHIIHGIGLRQKKNMFIRTDLHVQVMFAYGRRM